MKSFSFRRFAELLLLFGIGVAAGVALDRWLRPAGQAITFVPVSAPAAPAAEAPVAPAPAGALACSVAGAFENNLYPSLMLSFAAADPEYTRCITVSIRNAVKGRSYQVAVQSTLLEQPSVTTVTAAADHFEVRPDLAWNFASLRAVSQLRPENVAATVTSDADPPAAGLATCMVHPVNEAVSRILDPDTGNWVDLSVCFAAFVNEDHPWITQILQEASSRDGLARFSGYELGPESVVRQMRAVWDALAARGLTYVDVATTSSAVPGVATQYVRFLDQSVRDQGANCVDASVLLASIFRRIGLRPVLVFRPGHCLVAVYDSAQSGQLIGLETTMLNAQPFGDAFAMGGQELASMLPHMDTPGFSSVDIAVARQSGIRPIEYEP